MRHAIFVTAAALAATPLLAQVSAEYPSYEPGPDVRNGYTAEDIRDAEVRGAKGQKIGDVEDIVITPDNRLDRLLVSVNEGFLGIGGQLLAVSWDDVKVGKRSGGSIEYFTAAVTPQNVEEFGIFKDRQEAEGKKREWRASELIGDYINLKDFADYGVVSDLVFDRDGKLRAIAAAPDLSGSVLARFYAPYSGNDPGWDPGDDYYLVPYTRAELKKALPPEGPTRVSSGE